MILCRPWFLGLSAALFAIGLSACHESSGAPPNSLAPPKLPAGAISGLSFTDGGSRSLTAGGAPPAERSKQGEAEAVQRAGAAGASSIVGAPGALDSSPKLEVAATSVDAAAPLLDAAGKPLGQTDQRPTLTSASFQQRVAALAQAIISGELEPASGAFFPLVAYRQVKDVAKPERDYEFRLLAHFKRDLLEYHRALGSGSAAAQFQGITVPESSARWMAPGSEGNKLGYFRVLRSGLRFALPTGRTRDFELTSMISWRGEWYVVHLHDFK